MAANFAGCEMDFKGCWDNDAAGRVDKQSFLLAGIRVALGLLLASLSLQVGVELSLFAVPGPTPTGGPFDTSNTYWLNPQCTTTNLTEEVQNTCPRVIFQSGCSLNAGKFTDVAIPYVVGIVFLVAAIGDAVHFCISRKNKPEPSFMHAALGYWLAFICAFFFALIFWTEISVATAKDLCFPTLSPSSTQGIWDGTFEYWCTLPVLTRDDITWATQIASSCSGTSLTSGNALHVYYSASQMLLGRVAELKARLYTLGTVQLVVVCVLLCLGRPHGTCRYQRPDRNGNGDGGGRDHSLADAMALVPLPPKAYEPPRICCLRESVLSTLPLPHPLRDLVISYTDAVPCCGQWMVTVTKAAASKMDDDDNDGDDHTDIGEDSAAVAVSIDNMHHESDSASDTRARVQDWTVHRALSLNLDLSPRAYQQMMPQASSAVGGPLGLSIQHAESGFVSCTVADKRHKNYDTLCEQNAVVRASSSTNNSTFPVQDDAALLRHTIAALKELRTRMTDAERIQLVFDVMQVYCAPTQPTQLQLSTSHDGST